METNKNNSEKRVTMKSRAPLRDVRTNPFSHDRNSRPCLDTVFFKPARERDSSVSPDRSSSIIQQYDCLNMSIGARAAISEQTRQIAKYGLDGDGDGVQPWSTKSMMSNITERNTNDEWDRIMDRTHDNTSVIESISMSQSQSNASFLLMRGLGSAAGGYSTVNALDENQPLDMTCDQSDYFNSSKVMQLRTPEKNRAKVDEASRLARLGIGSLQKRGDVSVNESVSGSTSDELEQSGMIGLFQAAMKLGSFEDGDIDLRHEEDAIAAESFVSYQEPNMSIMNTNQMTMQKSITGAFDEDQQTDASLNYETLQMQNDTQASFISYREPDLSIMSDRGRDHTRSEFGNSEFEVDVSEIIAPSEFESKLRFESPYRQQRSSNEILSTFPTASTSSEIRTNHTPNAEEILFSTPIRSLNCDEPRLSNEEIWPSSPHSSLVNSPLHNHSCDINVTQENYDSSEIPMGHRSSPSKLAIKPLAELHIIKNTASGLRYISPDRFQYQMENDCNNSIGGSDVINRFLSPQNLLRDNKSEPLMKGDMMFLSPIDKQSSSDKSRQSNKVYEELSRGASNSFSTSKVNETGKGRENYKTQPKSVAVAGFERAAHNTQHDAGREVNGCPTLIPQRMSLRDRYSRPDRFLEGSGTITSWSTQTKHHSAQKEGHGDQVTSVNRSLLDSFERDYN